MASQVQSESKSATGHTAMEDFAAARENMPFERQNGWYTAGVGSVGPGGGNQQFSREQLAQISSEDRQRIIAEYEAKMQSTGDGSEQWMNKNGNIFSGVAKLFKKKDHTSDHASVMTDDSQATKVDSKP